MPDELRSGIPNESSLPHLHAIAYKRDQIINNNKVIKKSEVNEKTLEKINQELKDSRNKIIAVLKEICAGDVLAAEYILLNLIAKPHTRKDGFILGNLSINLSGFNIIQSKYLT